MSLENKIELLTVAIERLTAMLEKTAPTPSLAEPTPSLAEPTPSLAEPTETKPKATPPKAEPEVASITVDDLQSICTNLVKEDRANKPRIISVLDSFGVKVLSQLKASDMAEVKECLEALKNV